MKPRKPKKIKPKKRRKMKPINLAEDSWGSLDAIERM